MAELRELKSMNSNDGIACKFPVSSEKELMLKQRMTSRDGFESTSDSPVVTTTAGKPKPMTPTGSRRRKGIPQKRVLTKRSKAHRKRARKQANVRQSSSVDKLAPIPGSNSAMSDRNGSKGGATSPPAPATLAKTSSPHRSTIQRFFKPPPPRSKPATVQARATPESSEQAIRKERDMAFKELHDLKKYYAEELSRIKQLHATDLEGARAGAQRANAMLKKTLLEKSRFDRAKAREDVAQNGYRLGRFVQQRGYGQRGYGGQEVWHKGEAFTRLDAEQARLAALRTNHKEVAKAARKAKAEAKKGPNNPEALLAVLEQEEVVRLALASLKRQEAAFAQRKLALQREKMLYVREIKRVRDEDASQFSKLPQLGDRYLLLHMIGKGGFSEVWKTFDLQQHRYVACKIHQLNSHWSEEKKQSYTRHATREYAIHKSLSHQRVVTLYDVFEVDLDSFATVLEYCDGPDLDYVLKERTLLPEREARAIVVQIVSALVYMNTQKHRIIHYDLKPANILFAGPGKVKITDFGLSKIVPEGSSDQTGMELTSQGAGTYWYLPPECFMVPPPKISSKVDVWSLGAIFFQMLYGRKPFGHNMSQDKVLRERIMLHAHTVNFPPKPAVSEHAQDFIRLCLKHSQIERPDVHRLLTHEYLSAKPK